MMDPEVILASSRRAVSEFVGVARAIPPESWTTPRAPGKWSPGQVTEHVALTYEQSRHMLHGTFTGPTQPWYRQLLARRLFLPPLFKRGDFGKGPLQAPDFIRPSQSPAPAGVLLPRLETAAHDLEESLAGAADPERVMVDHPIFGRVPLGDLLHFLFVHTNHHRPQVPIGG